MAGGTLFFLLPVCMLSTIDVNSPFVPFSPLIVKSLATHGGAWARFYAASGALALIWPGSFILGYQEEPFYAAIVTGPTASQFTAVGNTITQFSATSANFAGTPSWTATGLPSGIKLSTAGVFSGKPVNTNADGAYAVTITASYTPNRGATVTASETFTWYIEALTATAPTGNRTSSRSSTISPEASFTTRSHLMM